MLPFIIFLLVVGVFVAGIVMLANGLGNGCSGKGEKYWLLIPGWLGIVLGFTAAVVVGIIWAANYFGSLDAVNDMEAFLNTRTAYEQAIADAEGVDIRGAGTGFVDIAYQEQSQAYTTLVIEYRDKIEWYNKTLEQTRALNGTFLGIFRVDVPDELQPIIVIVHERDGSSGSEPEQLPALPVRIVGD